jgi:hypothetical protein
MQLIQPGARVTWIVRSVVVAGVVLAGVVAAAPGCGGDAKPVVQPDDHPPLPPASGTPVGYLIDDATELALRDDQLVQLKAIDDELATQLAALDAHGHAPRAAPAAGGAAGGGGGRHGGGRHGGGGRRGGGGAGGGGAGSAHAAPAASAGGADAANHATEARADDVRDALARAFTILDPGQQQIARRVLTDRGVDLDAGRPTAPAERAPGSEPDAGSGDN